MKSARPWLVTTAALAGCAATLALGFWQWGRAEEKVRLQEAIDARAKDPAIELQDAVAARDVAAVMHRRVIIRGGEWAGPTLFLDNRQMEGKVGFYVVTALKVPGTANAAVAVQRGWAPRNFQRREQLPPVSTPVGAVAFEGVIAPPPARLFAFAGADSGAIRQNLDLSRFREETRLPLETRFSVQQVGAASDGLLRQWPHVGSGAERNWGYAFQWWALSALIAILYAWFQFIRPARAAR